MDRWSHVIQRHPWPAAILGLVFLLVLAIPLLSMRLGFTDAGNRPESDTTRQAYDLVAEGFGAGFNGPLLLAAETPNGQADVDALNELTDEAQPDEGRRVRDAAAGEPRGHGRGAAGVPHHRPAGRGHREPRRPTCATTSSRRSWVTGST